MLETLTKISFMYLVIYYKKKGTIIKTDYNLNLVNTLNR